MTDTKTLTLELDAGDYDRLETEARRRGLSLRELLRVCLDAALPPSETIAERDRRVGLAALDHLAELTAGLPPVDLTQVLEESRRQLEERTMGYGESHRCESRCRSGKQ